MGVQTLHRNENGTQRTYHVAPVEDATGETFAHTFEETADGIEYRGAGEPGDVDERDDAPASAVAALEAYTGESLDDA
ncbi:hypothetical protein [Halobaculum lipolyticum]|uniref:Uncharacterized protein n=1 Tax=Halobaculum lipolyticum TaxID=3032001 RepID=A0ABD5WG75_9EURY|nr:hypothetical protein [Halobaculum sp. DT31]